MIHKAAVTSSAGRRSLATLSLAVTAAAWPAALPKYLSKYRARRLFPIKQVALSLPLILFHNSARQRAPCFIWEQEDNIEMGRH